MKKFFIFALALNFFTLAICSNPIDKRSGRNKFVKKLMTTMTTKQMVGQLFMIDSYANNDSLMIKKVLRQIDSNYVGGVCFFKGNQQSLIELNKLYNQHSNIPLFISIDAEWGLAMRMSDAIGFPMQMSLGALPSSDYDLVYKMGENIAKQCNAMGININFAPDVDINTNSKNPVINMRSFGQDRRIVALLGQKYVEGMQDNGVMACIKHFPGHGDTQTDSHKATPIISHSKEYIDSIDSYPFRYIIDKGVWSVMIGHLEVNALSQDSLKPASINKEIIKDYLIRDLDFNGLVFTDAMNMKGLTSRYGKGEAEILALEAGVDMILMPENIDTSINAIMQAIENGRISIHLIKEKCKKILQWKYDMGLFTNQRSYALPSKDLASQAEKINQDIANKSICSVMKNYDKAVIGRQDTAVLFLVGATSYDTLINRLKNNRDVITYRVNSKTTSQEIDSLCNNLPSQKKVFTLISGGRFAKSNSHYGIPQKAISLATHICDKVGDTNTIILFANAYTLKYIDNNLNVNDIFVAYENSKYTQKAVSDLLLGRLSPKGSLSVTTNKDLIKEDTLLQEENLVEQIDYKLLKQKGINIKAIEQIDSIANEGIKQKAYPGCQIIIAKDTSIILKKDYGYLTYDSTKKVTPTTLYDLASVTKTLATTLAVMKLYEQGKISLDEQIKKYVPIYKHQKFGKLTVRELLSHYTTLPATYLFWTKTLKDGKLDSTIYSKDMFMDENYMPVTDSLFIKKDYKQVMQKQLKDVKTTEKKYTYSDLNFLLLQYMVENVSKKSLDRFLDEEFFAKMHLSHTYFNPLDNAIEKQDIAPTENDTLFRHQLIQGTVHDPMAALNGGVCGNAGMFSNSEDVYKICLMLLNYGQLNGVRYLDSTTIATFNTRYYADKNIRRALGFDKPFISSTSTHCSQYASQHSFGHSGFTGTYFWIDPDNQTIFIFLSNRVYPYCWPNNLAKMNIRTDINDLIYKALEE